MPLDIGEVFKPRVPKVAETFMEDEMMHEAETFMMREEPEPTASDTAPPPPIPPEDPAQTVALVKPAAPKAVSVVEQPAPAEWERRLEPSTMNDACLLAKRLHESHLFDSYGSPQAVLSTVLLGRELGLSAMAALRSVHIINGKHTLSAQLMVAIILKSGKADYFRLIESTETSCTYETKRKGRTEPTNHTYTIEDARTAGLLGNANYKKMPKPMLRARCSSELARIEYPDLLAGLYTPEELRDANNGD